jgi:hypothetical protein
VSDLSTLEFVKQNFLIPPFWVGICLPLGFNFFHFVATFSCPLRSPAPNGRSSYIQTRLESLSPNMVSSTFFVLKWDCGLRRIKRKVPRIKHPRIKILSHCYSSTGLLILWAEHDASFFGIQYRYQGFCCSFNHYWLPLLCFSTILWLVTVFSITHIVAKNQPTHNWRIINIMLKAFFSLQIYTFCFRWCVANEKTMLVCVNYLQKLNQLGLLKLFHILFGKLNSSKLFFSLLSTSILYLPSYKHT